MKQPSNTHLTAQYCALEHSAHNTQLYGRDLQLLSALICFILSTVCLLAENVQCAPTWAQQQKFA